MAANIGKGGALRHCDHCLQVDDHPRHQFAGGIEGVHPRPTPAAVRTITDAVAELPEADADRIITEFLDTGSLSLHLDCCRNAGCPTGECNIRTAGVEDLRGARLLKHLIALQQTEAKESGR